MLSATFSNDYLRQLELLKIRARRAYLGTRQGSHKSLKRGYGMEFSDYRHYELGDDPRYIDWSAYARNEKLFVKVFEEEQDLSVLLIIDASLSMLNPKDDRKWEMARDIAYSLAYIALLQQDRVSVAIPGIFYSPYYVGGGAIHHLSNDISRLKLETGNDIVSGVQRAAAKLHFPGVAVLISDFLMPFEEIEKACNILRAKNLDITAIQVLGENDLRPFTNEKTIKAVDSENGEEIEISLNQNARVEYDALLKEHNNNICQFFNEARISYALAEVPLGVRNFVINNLTKTALLQ